MTVRQVAEKMGAPLVDGSTIHFGHADGGGMYPYLTVLTCGQTFYWSQHTVGWVTEHHAEPFAHDISHLPASQCFVGFFGEAFDRIAQEGECTS